MTELKLASWGTYKGKRLSDGTVKKIVNFQGLKIHVDRPKGFIQRGRTEEGRAWERTYKYDYGFIPKTMGGDDDGLDCFIGPNLLSPNSFWVMQKHADDTFDEYKVFLGFDTKEEAKTAYLEHVPARYFDNIASIGVDMMKAMLGINPDGIKQASRAGFRMYMLKQGSAQNIAPILKALTLNKRLELAKAQRDRHIESAGGLVSDGYLHD